MDVVLTNNVEYLEYLLVKDKIQSNKIKPPYGEFIETFEE